MTLLVLVLAASPSRVAWSALDQAVSIGSWGRKVDLPPQALQVPHSITVDSSTGEVYTVETRGIKRWDADGIFLGAWACPCAGIGVNETTHEVYASNTSGNLVERFTREGLKLGEWGGSGSGPGAFDGPFGISVDSATGEVYVVDTGNKRVQIFDMAGLYLREFTHPNMVQNSNSPAGLAFDPLTSAVWVANPNAYVVLKFDSAGNPILQIGNLASPAYAIGSFRWPRSVAVAPSGKVYVTDTDSERIQVFESDGTSLGAFAGPNTLESGPFHPRSIAVNRTTGDLYVLAAYAPRIDKFDSAGGYLFSFGGREKDGPVFLLPKGMAVSPVNGDVYVFDSGNFLMKHASAGGAFLGQWGGSDRIDNSAPGLFGAFSSSAVAVDAAGAVWAGLATAIVYLDDPPAHFIQKFTPTGSHLSSFIRRFVPFLYFEVIRDLAIDRDTGHVWSADSQFHQVQEFDPNGQLLQTLTGIGRPSSIALHAGHLYIADYPSNRVHHIDPNGRRTQFGSPGSADGELALTAESHLTTDAAGNIYVADTLNHRIQEFSPEGVFLGKFGTFGKRLGEFRRPVDLAFSPDFSVLHVLENVNHRVQWLCMPEADPAQCRSNLDTDGDGVVDAEDNCAFTTNADQLDLFGINSAAADGIGDSCQCGEVTGDGAVDQADEALLRRRIADPSQSLILERCSVFGDSECDVLDRVVLSRALQGLPPGIRQACSASRRAP